MGSIRRITQLAPANASFWGVPKVNNRKKQGVQKVNKQP
jgi:hypothetical protein